MDDVRTLLWGYLTSKIDDLLFRTTPESKLHLSYITKADIIPAFFLDLPPFLVSSTFRVSRLFLATVIRNLVWIQISTWSIFYAD